MSAYMLGFVLECILKAASCKTLNLAAYPEDHKVVKNPKITDYFRTHNFDMLLVISGASDLFSPKGVGFNSWSGFTQEYTGKIKVWTDIRYDTKDQYDEKRVKDIYDYLTKPNDGIIALIEAKERW